jgi:hypothetical protein
MSSARFVPRRLARIALVLTAVALPVAIVQFRAMGIPRAER